MADVLTMTASDKPYITTITHMVNNTNGKKETIFTCLQIYIVVTLAKIVFSRD